jgi:predicted HTH domain antitoxin
MSEQQPNVEQRVDFDKKFSEERSEWTEKIRVLSVRMKNIRELGEVQVELFSSRQILLEYSAKLGQVMTKLNSKHRKDRGERLRHYSENTQVKYGANEKTPLIEGDLSELKERIDIVENQISFINETIKTVDHCLYGIKSRIALEEYLRSGAVKNNY